jgi:hypothetical protein
VIAGWNGQALRPYVRYRQQFEGDWHIGAGFSGAALSRVGRFTGADSSGGQPNCSCQLWIDRARLTVGGTNVVVTQETLIASLDVTPHHPPRAPLLDPTLDDWQEAVNALYRRLACKGCGLPHFFAR